MQGLNSLRQQISELSEIEGSQYVSKNLPSPNKGKNKIYLQEHLFNTRRLPRVTSNPRF